MAKYTVTCEKCGIDITVQLTGPNRDRQWAIDHWTWICDECKELIRKEENEKAAKINESAGLPELKGSDKQIAWAETIRAKKVSELDKSLSDNDLEYLKKRAHRQGIADADKKIDIAIVSIKSKTSASWWIDSRDYNAEMLLLEELKTVKLPEEQIQIEVQKVIEAEVKLEATVRPEHPITETVAEITHTQDTVKISFPERNDQFREIVKFKLDYTWDAPCWTRKMGVTDENIKDRAAEAGYKLLAAGFCIRIIDEDLRQKAISGQYKTECKKWITSPLSFPGKLGIWWKKDSGDYYARARRIPGAKWISPSIKVPAEHYEEVLGFAEVHGFQVTPGAQKIIDQAKKAKEEALTVNIKLEPERRLFDIGKPPVLEIPEEVTVNDEFKD